MSRRAPQGTQEIVKPKTSWVRLLFTVRGTSHRFTWQRIIDITLFSVLVTWVEMRYRIDQSFSPEQSLAELTDVQCGSERIKNTPIPYAHTVLIHRLVAFYCVVLPFGIVREVRALTPVVTLLIAHTFFGLDDIGGEIEDPFDTDPQALPLDALSRIIEINLLQSIDAQEVPEMLQPKQLVLF